MRKAILFLLLVCLSGLLQANEVEYAFGWAPKPQAQLGVWPEGSILESYYRICNGPWIPFKFDKDNFKPVTNPQEDPPAIPLPPAVLLMGSALVGLTLISRRNRGN